jgi:hypothetical protein
MAMENATIDRTAATGIQMKIATVVRSANANRASSSWKCGPGKPIAREPSRIAGMNRSPSSPWNAMPAAAA